MAAAPPDTPHAAHFDDLPMVGTSFFDGKPVGGNATHCNGPNPPGSGETWKHAKQIVSGDFSGTGEFDLMVRWDDGRMTLHGDVGSNGLGAGVEMAPSGSIWSHAPR
ncbi:hypothetical protein HET69_42165 [Streptomyces sp. CJ_13]|uniref:hypothetical protein n=1 Tax=Streptomyces sp. CJ_13 TaxID=2724943 RepID=UPI001BDCCD37|nr:hypothetical protein [Streptomyces sp. CJ_13]MBT1190398.1 hypothetical protein [Streptomyces sp. CJ_13]